MSEDLERELSFLAAVQRAPDALTAAAALRRRDRERDEATRVRTMASVIDLAHQVSSLGEMRMHLPDMLAAGESWVKSEDDPKVIAKFCETMARANGRREAASPEQRRAAAQTEQPTPQDEPPALPDPVRARMEFVHEEELILLRDIARRLMRASSLPDAECIRLGMLIGRALDGMTRAEIEAALRR